MSHKSFVALINGIELNLNHRVWRLGGRVPGLVWILYLLLHDITFFTAIILCLQNTCLPTFSSLLSLHTVFVVYLITQSK